MRINLFSRALIANTFAILIVCCQGQSLPRYSLDNMPKTKFTCRDKILGGYYADAETQCQMFHVCVKVAGVGIQDFRFLCPNGTAFDQEAQICADWGDVDCETATLYYGSDNFDLYRIGSGFESKRAPFAEEEEAEFHLQRAETSDARRSKQFIVNQSSRPATPPNVFKASTVSIKPYQTTSAPPKQDFVPITTQAPLRTSNNFNYSPVSSTASYNDFFTPTKKFNNNDEIFKGSHSGNFFHNRNGKDGDEDFTRNSPAFTTTRSTTSIPPTSTTYRPLHRAPQRIRSRGHVRAQHSTLEPFFESSTNATTTSTPAPFNGFRQPVQNLNIQSVSNNGAIDRRQKTQSLDQFDKFTGHSKSPEKSFNPSTVIFPVLASSTPSYQSSFNTAKTPIPSIPFTYPTRPSTTTTSQAPFLNYQTFYNVSLPASSPAPFQKAFIPDSSTTTTTSAPSTFEVERSRAPQNPFFNANFENKATEKSFSPAFNQFPATNSPEIKPSTYNPHTFNRGGVLRVNNFQEFTSRNSPIPTPTPSAETSISSSSGFSQKQFAPRLIITTSVPPSAFSGDTFFQNQSPVSRNFQQTTTPTTTTERSRPQDNYTPTTSVKRFSTLVPKELYSPTTFKPTSFANKKPADSKIYRIKFPAPPPPSAPTATPSGKDGGDDDEDDGSYRPELYEKDLYKNKLRAKLANKNRGSFNYYQSTSTTTVRTPVQHYEEDEFLKTAHSQNIAASGNELRAERARQVASRINELLSDKTSTSPKATTTTTATSAPKKPALTTPENDKDASYDYQYYDIGAAHPSEDEYGEVIEEFGKTKPKQKKKN